MDRRRESQTLRAIEISLDTARAPPRRGIEVNTDENRIPIGIADGDAGDQWDENIAVSRHHNAIARSLKNCFQSLANIEIHHALGGAPTGDSAAIVSAMTRSDNYGSGLPWSLGTGASPLHHGLRGRPRRSRTIDSMLPLGQ